MPKSARARPEPADDPPTSGWRVFAESVPGTSHARAGTSSEDSFHFEVTKSGCLAAAIADGSGTSSLGGLAAQVAAKAAVDSLVHSLPRHGRNFGQAVRQAMVKARSCLLREVKRQDCKLEDLGTTLITMVATAERVAVAQIGDGFALAVDPEHRPIGFSRPQNGEFVNETVFLNAPSAVESIAITQWYGSIAGVALLTDGLQRLAWKLPEAQPHEPFFASLFRVGADSWDRTRAQVSGLLHSDRVAAKTDDDVTMIVAWRR